MTQKIRASVLHGVRDVRLEERSLDAPKEDELQISVRSTGICGSDLHYYHHYRNGDIIVREPMSLGHESAGVIDAVGSSVAGFEVGDRVALEAGIPCGNCDRCDEGRYNLCKSMSFRSSAKSFPHFQGTLQEKVNHPAAWCHRLPENVSLEEGALLEPLSVAIHATRRAEVVPGCRTLVLGAGAVGMLVASMLKVMGSSTIVIADIEPKRVEFAIQNKFADRGFVVPKTRSVSTEENLEIAKSLAESTGKTLDLDGRAIGEFDVVFECTGVETCLQAAIYATRAAGKVLLVGMGTPIQTLPVSAFALKEVDLIGVFRYAATYEYGMSLLASKAKPQKNGEKATGRPLPDLSKLVTHRFRGLDHVKDAFDLATKGNDEDGKMVMKVVIDTGAR